MLILAREVRGLSQQELAQHLNMQKAWLSKVENDNLRISEEKLVKIAQLTSFRILFFYKKNRIIHSPLSFRRRNKVPASVISPLEARMNLACIDICQLTTRLEMVPPKLPHYSLSEDLTPAQAAQQLRQHWKCKEAIIDNLTQLLERMGIFVVSFDFETDRIDSRVLLTENGFPVIFVNKRLKGDRQRFSLAFELGHLVLHTQELIAEERDIQHESNLFAAAFLMPEAAVRKDIKTPVTLLHLGDLKRKWKVSMISLLYRADDLGLMTQSHKQNLIQQFNQMKLRRHEPPHLDIAAEQPELLKNCFRKLVTDPKADLADSLSPSFCFLPDEFRQMYY